MKHVFFILLCLSLPLSAKTPHRPAARATPVATPVPATVPEAQAEPLARQRTVAEDDALRQWITDIMETSDKAIAKADDAEKHADAAETEAKTSREQSAQAGAALTTAQGQLTQIQTAYDKMQAQLAAALAKLAKVLKLAETFAWVIGAELAVIVLFACLKFGLPSVAPPWGIVATCALPLLALGVVKVLPHVQ